MCAMTTRPQGAADGERRRDSPMFGTRRGYLTLALLTAVYAHSALCQYLIGACATELEADVGLSPQGLGFAPVRYDGALAVAAAEQDDPLARAIAANVEITICATAAGFLGTRTSTFSLSIAEERQGVFGRPAASAGVMGDMRASQRNKHVHEDL